MSAHGWNVSRETHTRLTEYAALVRKWSPAINLVSKRDLDHIEQRHITDSLQIWALRTEGTHCVGLDSGG